MMATKREYKTFIRGQRVTLELSPRRRARGRGSVLHDLP